MLYSMTGFGQATETYKDKKIIFEVRSLNGKSTDLRLRYPSNYKAWEIAIRKTVLDGVMRGKIDGTLIVESELGEESYSLNKALFNKYYKELSEVVDEHSITGVDMLQSILRIPNVVMAAEVPPEEEEWAVAQKVIKKAIENITNFRTQEGEAMLQDLTANVEGIRNSMERITPFEDARIENVKTRMRKNLSQYLTEEKIDQNRFEQELLFYIERLDINEERIRLAQHCNYFLEVMNSPEISKGKKLAFISQEMGREINTLGAKAQEHNVQQLVVEMKDYLERIKEQIANIL